MNAFFWVFVAIAIVALVVTGFSIKRKRNPAKDLGGTIGLLVLAIFLLPLLFKKR